MFVKMTKESAPPMPTDAPTAGEVYKHYKGDLYGVVGLALHSTNEWIVVYKGLYEGAAAELFSRPLSEWHEIVEWEGSRLSRFVKEQGIS